MLRPPPRSTLFPTRRSSDLHRHKTGWTTQIEVPQPAFAHLRRVIGISEIDPLQVRAIDSVRREEPDRQDRKSTRLNSSHSSISYAVFCLKKKKKKKNTTNKQ